MLKFVDLDYVVSYNYDDDNPAEDQYFSSEDEALSFALGLVRSGYSIVLIHRHSCAVGWK